MNWKMALQKLSISSAARGSYAHLTRVALIGPILRKLGRAALPEGTRVWVPIRGGLGEGLLLYLDPRFEMDYASGNYETQIQDVLRLHLSTDSVFYDIGAHLGVVSMFANEPVKPAGMIFGLEADPRNATRAEEHVKRNGLNRIHIVPLAVWSFAGQLQFEPRQINPAEIKVL
jgi:hypothetical protein